MKWRQRKSGCCKHRERVRKRILYKADLKNCAHIYEVSDQMGSRVFVVAAVAAASAAERSWTVRRRTELIRQEREAVSREVEQT